MRHPASVPFFVLCITVSSAAQEPVAPLAPPAAAAPQPFEKELLDAAKQYSKWTRVSDRANFVPTMCQAQPPDGVQRSASTDTDTHGRKLYYLFAKKADAYMDLTMFESEKPAERDALVQKLVGQVVVKQSWKAVEVPLASVPKLDEKKDCGRPIPEDYAIDGAKAYHTGQQGDLFVMLKVDPKTPGTDVGWVYGTLTPDGSKVTASGLIASCMECHKDAPRDRLFGFFPPKAKAKAKPSK